MNIDTVSEKYVGGDFGEHLKVL